jgi:hypothetical protein
MVKPFNMTYKFINSSLETSEALAVEGNRVFITAEDNEATVYIEMCPNDLVRFRNLISAIIKDRKE